MQELQDYIFNQQSHNSKVVCQLKRCAANSFHVWKAVSCDCEPNNHHKKGIIAKVVYVIEN